MYGLFIHCTINFEKEEKNNYNIDLEIRGLMFVGQNDRGLVIVNGIFLIIRVICRLNWSVYGHICAQYRLLLLAWMRFQEYS